MSTPRRPGCGSEIARASPQAEESATRPRGAGLLSRCLLYFRHDDFMPALRQHTGAPSVSVTTERAGDPDRLGAACFSCLVSGHSEAGTMASPAEDNVSVCLSHCVLWNQLANLREKQHKGSCWESS